MSYFEASQDKIVNSMTTILSYVVMASTIQVFADSQQIIIIMKTMVKVTAFPCARMTRKLVKLSRWLQ